VNPDPSFLLVLSAFPTAESAGVAARALVAEGLAACVSLLPGVTSHYRWRGKLEEASEVMALIKTSAASYEKLEARLRELHPHEVPEIISVPVARGLGAYLEWVAAESRG
jgi:periplasmic divalent cation tolerance protein